ncbi:uncharacterized protein LOC143863671 [Tasmannia lanceolata]|uniref:uncharacterized protein LOC143863662 n=1 Tax=Tasmannia lanceolata TaxID=3420 RepID=UPI0040642B39
MLPSNARSGGVLHSYTEQFLLSDVNPSNYKHDFSSPFFYFSPTIEHPNDFLHNEPDLLSRPFSDPILMANAITTANETVTKAVPARDMAVFPKISKIAGRKKGGKKDRHSKIFTAQGQRDRRMRLSLEIARKFFDLQDMLGYDKASQTVGWLLNKSKAAIKEVTRGFTQTNGSSSGGGGGTKSVSSTSECEVVSGMDESTDNSDRRENKSKEKSVAANRKGKKIRQKRKDTFHLLARESRVMARARARERTRKKMWGRRFEEPKQWPEARPHDRNQLSSLSPLETVEESDSHNKDKKSSMDFAAEVEAPSTRSLDRQGSIHDIVHESLPITCKHGPASIFDYNQHIAIPQGVNCRDLISLNNNGLINIFPENWDMNSTGSFQQPFVDGQCVRDRFQHPFINGQCVGDRITSSFFKNSSGVRPPSQSIDAQFCVKPWEAFKNESL